jgi:hypothetical protein
MGIRHLQRWSLLINDTVALDISSGRTVVMQSGEAEQLIVYILCLNR